MKINENFIKHIKMLNKKNVYIKLIFSILITLIFCYFVYIFNVPNPNAILYIVVVVLTFYGGFLTGVPSSIIAIIYSIFYFSDRKNIFFNYTVINAEKLIIASISLIIIVIIVGILVKKIDKKNEELRVAIKKLESISRIDALTGLANRRAFDDVFSHKYANARRRKESLVIMMIDIDFFKQFNDTYGHMEGDKCLQNISAVFNTTINRASDFVARFGGEEFIILLEDTDKNGAVKVATDIQNNIHNLRIPHDTSSVNPYITVSIGIVVAHPDSSSVKETLVQNADKALYQAKNNGRNCIDVFKL